VLFIEFSFTMNYQRIVVSCFSSKVNADQSENPLYYKYIIHLGMNLIYNYITHNIHFYFSNIIVNY